jgi:hypothetical protein
MELTLKDGSAMAQAVSRWFSSASARIRIQVMSCEICGEKIGTGAGFLRVLPFPLPIIPRTVLHSSSFEDDGVDDNNSVQLLFIYAPT